jgi:23S rRNA pseudouridine1911/1915/1917 synthase
VTPALQVLYEDNHLLVLNKPAMLATMGSSAGTPSLWSMAKDYLRCKYHKPGNVFLGVVSRIDSPVTGIVVFARTSKAAARLSRLYRDRDVVKEYWAVVSGRLRPHASQYADWLAKDLRTHRMVISSPVNQPAREAVLTYEVEREIVQRGQPIRTLVRIRLMTGRKHQIRVQFAHRGHPIVGDRKYGSPEAFPSGMALHARRLIFQHPVRKTPIDITAPLPASWRRLGIGD